MAFLDRLVPGRAKTNLARSIEELHEAAQSEVRRQGMRRDTALLWEAMCSSSAEVLRQLLVENTDKQLDWGLKRHRHRFNQPRLAAFYWWLLLYHFVLFKRRGADRFSPDDIFPELHQSAQRFIERLAASPDFDVVVPQPWEERWRSQYSVEASLGLYNRVMEMLGLKIDLDRRINRVSLFTSATERAYDAMVKEQVQGQMR